MPFNLEAKRKPLRGITMNYQLTTNLLLPPSARRLFYPYAFGILAVRFLVAASGSNSKRLNTLAIYYASALKSPRGERSKINQN